MQIAALQRAGGGRVAFVAGGSRRHAARRQQQHAQRQFSRLHVAALEEPETLAPEEEEVFDKEEAYRRFAQLLDEFSISHRTGDKVGAAPARATDAAGESRRATARRRP